MNVCNTYFKMLTPCSGEMLAVLMVLMTVLGKCMHADLSEEKGAAKSKIKIIPQGVEKLQ
jgi:methionine-rich copper-binding protein CopC